jgi:methyl-accepting chemotaxis protein
MGKTSRIRNIISGILIALVVLEAFDFFGGYDFVKAAVYQPTSEMETIIGNLGLTGRGERTLKATRPELETREVFNEKCDSHNVEVYVLGCYQTGEDIIHLYDVDEGELDGVKESTAAHELLHAVYHRLPFWAKNSLNENLKKYYESLDDESEIKESMKLYNDVDFYDELHSRLGTEVKNLPIELEKHYDGIFNDQDKIVEFFEKYSSTFKKYEQETKELGEKIEKLKTEIDVEEKRLETLSDELNTKIKDYNNRVDTKNYASVDAIIKEGDNLRAAVNSANAAYDSLNEKIKEYNNMISEYNNSVIRTNQIYDSINSNSNNLNMITN